VDKDNYQRTENQTIRRRVC